MTVGVLEWQLVHLVCLKISLKRDTSVCVAVLTNGWPVHSRPADAPRLAVDTVSDSGGAHFNKCTMLPRVGHPTSRPRLSLRGLIYVPVRRIHIAPSHCALG